MMKKIFLVILLLLISWNVFAGLRFGSGEKTFNESPSENISQISYLNTVIDFIIPVLKVGFIADFRFGTKEDKPTDDKIIINDRLFGIKKEFLTFIKPFIAVGTSQNQIIYDPDGPNNKIFKEYNGTWYSYGVKLSFSGFGIEAERKVDSGEEVNFDGTSYDLGSSSFSLGIGITF